MSVDNINKLQQYVVKCCKAIECLNSQEFVEAALMLTYASIDQMSWLAVSDKESNRQDFKDWVVRYLNLSSLGCSADDLWAARNGLIHMATAESRDFYNSKKNGKNNVRKIYYVSGNVVCTKNESDDVVVINSTKLMSCFVEASLAFLDDLDRDVSKKLIATKKAESMLAFQRFA